MYVFFNGAADKRGGESFFPNRAWHFSESVQVSVASLAKIGYRVWAQPFESLLKSGRDNVSVVLQIINPEQERRRWESMTRLSFFGSMTF